VAAHSTQGREVVNKIRIFINTEKLNTNLDGLTLFSF